MKSNGKTRALGDTQKGAVEKLWLVTIRRAFP